MSQEDLYTNIFGSSTADQKAGILQKSIQQYPFFSIAHYYLLKETIPADKNYSHIAGRTALHFNNPFYLNYLLGKKETFSTQGFSSPVPIHRAEEIPVELLKLKPGPIQTIKNNEEEMIFEPLFASDYFASQGIKLSEEIKADDTLGKQLKSFTAWLKTMKSVHEQRLPPGNEQIDIAVRTIAEKSNMEEDVITESMAEVYINQGKPVKAQEIYHKLSLLNPSKSAYFAAKSELLKK